MALYDAFISYSHANDKAIATALQSVVQKLGKPWYQRRALRVFRDDTSLSATPQLWPTIEQALSESRFLIVLCSAQAANSRWVNKEVAYWLAHKSVDSLLIGVTDGELVWDDAIQDFAVREPMALPSALKGQFRSEPRWVDLRPYRAAAKIADTNFIELSANFAAAIRGIPKEDLLSQEIREQRRAKILAWSGAGALAILTVLAGWQWQTAEAAKKVAINERDNASRNFGLAKNAADGLVVNIAQGLRDVEGLRAESVRKILGTARATFEQLTASAPNSLELQFSRAAMLGEFGDTHMTLGNLPEALDYFREQIKTVERIAASDPGSSRWQRSLSIAHESIGRALEEQGKFDEALKSYREDLAIARRLLASDGDNPQLLRDVATALNFIGNVNVEQGKLDETLKSYNEDLNIVKRLTDGDLSNKTWQEDLSIAYGKIADVFEAQGRMDEALEMHQKELVTVQQLVDSDRVNTQWRYSLSIAHERKGVLLQAKGDLEGAQREFQENLSTIDTLVKSDPGNTKWQHVSSIAHERLGTLLLARNQSDEALQHYRKSFAIFKALAASDRTNKGWQRDLSVLYDRIGDQLLAHGNADEASRLYSEAFSIYQRLADSDPENSLWQWYLAISHAKQGDIFLRQNRADDALASYQNTLTILKRIVASDDSNTRWRQDLAIAYSKIASVYARMGRQVEALGELRAGRAILTGLLAIAPGSAKWSDAIATFDREIDRLEAGENESAKKQVSVNEVGRITPPASASKPTASWRLENDDETVTFTFPSTPPVALGLDAAGVEEMLKTLGTLRAAMRPEISRTFAPGQVVQAVSDPIWYTEPDPMWGSSWLHIRDPQFGWRHYLIPKDEARKLVGYLQAQVNAPIPERAPDKAE